MVNFPKKKNTHCKKCNKHESHAITWQVRRQRRQRVCAQAAVLPRVDERLTALLSSLSLVYRFE